MIRRILISVGLIAVVTLPMVTLSTCGKQYALLLTIRAQDSATPLSVYDLRIKDLATNSLVLERVGEKVDPNNLNRDISKEGQELKIAIEFESEGNYLVYIWARSGQGSGGGQFFLRDFQVDDVVEKDVLLTPLENDEDGDGFPKCGSPGITCGPTNCTYLDCNDKVFAINPFAAEVCENGVDDDCSAGCGAAAGVGDEKCVDSDGDGVPAGQDCDDSDPCRSPNIPEFRNMCGKPATAWDVPGAKACKDKLAAAGQPFSPPFCGDGIDQDCNGKDVACFPDEDCDNFSPPQDCNDKDPKISPQAPELCDGKDNNCNKVIDEGCLPCDVDGDQHAKVGYPGTDCNYPRDDTDDYDAGRYPGTTADDGGLEGGTVAGALREYCSSTKKDKNGKLAQRDTDHDGDGKNAADDGCPTVACDADGDGFKGAQCNPSASEKDCDDSDPHVFPGAPDICGNGIAENCVADVACASCTDSDGDGYCGRPGGCTKWADCPEADCEDNNPNVHPWALEKCDRIDNDCDNLVDEDNVDNAGVPMAVDVDVCNDDNDGKCAEPPQNGVCVCSPLDTRKVYRHDPADNRLRCTGESFGAAASPRCFEAIQPTKERCDTDDWNCDSKPFDSPKDVPGDYFDYGVSCGKSIGTCGAGIVTDCNLSQTLLSEQMSVLGSGHNQHWICTDANTKQPVKLPTQEQCNGFDDDCDGVGSIQDVTGTDLGWKELDEKDVDSDKYMKCSGPCPTLATGLKGCDDCNDLVASTYPGAFEKCDSVDNNCKSGDEGTGDCLGTWSCCPAPQNACRQLATDYQNCNTCGTTCPANTTNDCVNSTCVCGSTGGPCSGGRNCVGTAPGGTCQCIANGLCGGCCSSNNCLAGNTIAACGTQGESCDTCTTSNPCRNPICNVLGNCAESNKADGTACPSGKCSGGNCCTGCLQSGICFTTPDNAHCGTSGVNCTTCSTTNQCRSADCSTGGCNISYRPNGTICTGGLCYNGNCCTGCWNGTACDTTPDNSSCGTGGALCGTCSTPDFCKSASCPTGVCGITNKTDGTGCTGGLCYGGSCCTVCVVNGTCQTSSNDSHCGTAGETCDICNSGQDCVSGNCVCNAASCSSGCCDGDTCNSPTAAHCGLNGAACVTCTAFEDCISGSCTFVCNAASCPSGCCDGNICRPGTTDALCGTGGATCDTCTASEDCISGICTFVCNAASCPSGCCEGGVCYVDNAAHCGTGGGGCVGCNTDLACSSGTCTCTTSSCSSGCCDSNVCYPGTADDFCGSGGTACVACGGSTTCQSHSCQ